MLWMIDINNQACRFRSAKPLFRRFTLSAEDLPRLLKEFLAQRMMREHHAIWHLVRSRWEQLSETRQKHYRDLGWKPPRFMGDALSGIDFLGMHREMIDTVKSFVEDRKLDLQQVEGWAEIPWKHDDPEWPMPPEYHDDPDPLSKLQFTTDSFQREANDRYLNDSWLKSVSVDRLGILIEGGIHAWMHTHWADEPWYKPHTGKSIDDIRNDYLADFYSSHVNKHFWKLHGWIDNRIAAWEKANGEQADLSQCWSGPKMDHSMGDHDGRAGKRLINTEEIMMARAQLRPDFLVIA
jgi:hypothetical protein